MVTAMRVCDKCKIQIKARQAIILDGILSVYLGSEKDCKSVLAAREDGPTEVCAACFLKALFGENISISKEAIRILKDMLPQEFAKRGEPMDRFPDVSRRFTWDAGNPLKEDFKRVTCLDNAEK